MTGFAHYGDGWKVGLGLTEWIRRLNGRSLRAQSARLAALTLIAVITLTSVVWVGLGSSPRTTMFERELNPAVQALWERADSPAVQEGNPRAWIWGAEPVAMTTEHYPESPTGLRELVYYDKGRLDILDPGGDASSAWYATGALLVTELLSGRVQLGAQRFVERESPAIPLTGDLDQPNPVTYATLAPYSDVYPSAAQSRRIQPAIGAPVTALLQPDGVLNPTGVPDSAVTIAYYDAALGYNVAAPFAEWATAQPYPELYLLGHALSEPYWVDTVLDGQPRRVLVQAFERRILSYTPDNPAGWQVESTNVGLHYRAWRGLEYPEDPVLIPLASGEPFGEELVTAAQAAGIDPFMLAAISRVASGGDPFLEHANGGRGLAAVLADAAERRQLDALLDPTVNAQRAAQTLASWLPTTSEIDWRAVLANYYAGGLPNWDDPALGAFVDGVLATHGQLQALYPPLELDLRSEIVFGGPLSAGPAAYYDPSYTVAWWERTLLYYQSIGVIAPEWAPDPDGYYCVRPGYLPGERLQLRANGVTIECTVGDMVADRDLDGWLNTSRWAVELSWPTFVALGLDKNNWVEVDYPGTWPKSPPPIPPTPEPTPTPSPSPSPTPEATPEATPQPTETPTTPIGVQLPGSPPPPVEATPSPVPTEPPPATTTPEPPPEPSATTEPQPEPTAAP